VDCRADRLTATGNGRDGDWLRVSHRGFFVGEARDWDGVARLGVDIGDIGEALGVAACAELIGNLLTSLDLSRP
jgi:hypothetical protein